MPSSDEPLVVFGREFDGFTRALDRQFGLMPDLPARHELLEIPALEHLVVDGDGATSGAADVLMLNTDWLPNLIEQQRVLPLDDYLRYAVDFYTRLLGFHCVHRQVQRNEYTSRLVGYPDAHLLIAQLPARPPLIPAPRSERRVTFRAGVPSFTVT